MASFLAKVSGGNRKGSVFGAGLWQLSLCISACFRWHPFPFAPQGCASVTTHPVGPQPGTALPYFVPGRTETLQGPRRRNSGACGVLSELISRTEGSQSVGPQA